MNNKNYEVGTKVWYEKNGILQGEITSLFSGITCNNEKELFVVLDYNVNIIKPIKDVYLTKEDAEKAVIDKAKAVYKFRLCLIK